MLSLGLSCTVARRSGWWAWIRLLLLLSTWTALLTAQVSLSAMTKVPASMRGSALLPRARRAYTASDWRSLQSLPSSNPAYNVDEVRADLIHLMRWADDRGALTGDKLNETIAAIMSAAARYFPEVPTRAMCRTLIADIKTESDFNTTLVSGGRLDSGTSWGLLQVSPGGGSQELEYFKQHARTKNNTFSWSINAGSLGVLIDWETGQRMELDGLTNADLFRPWINIHVAAWTQSNSARTSSQDPSDWPNIASVAARARASESAFLDSKSAAANRLRTGERQAEQGVLVGAGLPRSVKTGLGTWVAGAAADGPGSYAQDGDDISAQYIATILEGVSELYGKKIRASWLDSLQVNAGLVDFR